MSQQPPNEIMQMKLLPRWAGVSHPVVGMVHLRSLPGSPFFEGNLEAVRDAALADARALAQGGVHGVMVENFGDAPFFADEVGPETVAHMTCLAEAVRLETGLPLGVNVLRNDALSAMAVAHAAGADFIRVNVLCGSAVTDQGIITGKAAALLRLRRSLDASHIKIFADVRVKHAAPLVARPLGQEIEEMTGRGGADAIIVTGDGTGKPVDAAMLAQVSDVAGDTPVFVGSGATAESLSACKDQCDGFIVGSGFKPAGNIQSPIDTQRVHAFCEALSS